MGYIKIIVIYVFLIVTLTHAQNIDQIVENIYQTSLEQEAKLDSLGDYSHLQKVHFTKLDGDGEVDEQSKREFRVKVRSHGQRNRELIAANDFEDGSWINVLEEEKSKKMKANTRSQKFSLTEMVGTEERKKYNFKLIGESVIKGDDTIQIYAEPLEEEEDMFKGDLWFDKSDYTLVKARLVPSEFPTGVEDMMMEFSMERFGLVRLPSKIYFEAEISFLFIFNGRIMSEILFEDYHFNQSFPDSIFLQ